MNSQSSDSAKPQQKPNKPLKLGNINIHIFSLLIGVGLGSITLLSLDKANIDKISFSFEDGKISVTTHPPDPPPPLDKIMSDRDELSSTLGKLKTDYGLSFIPDASRKKDSPVQNYWDSINYNTTYKKEAETYLVSSLKTLCENTDFTNPQIKESNARNRDNCFMEYPDLVEQLRREAENRSTIFTPVAKTILVSGYADTIGLEQKQHEVFACSKFLADYNLPIHSKIRLTSIDRQKSIKVNIIGEYNDYQLTKELCDRDGNVVLYLGSKAFQDLFGQPPDSFSERSNSREIKELIKDGTLTESQLTPGVGLALIQPIPKNE